MMVVLNKEKDIPETCLECDDYRRLERTCGFTRENTRNNIHFDPKQHRMSKCPYTGAKNRR